MKWTRAGLLRAAAAGGIAVAGGTALASASEDMDPDILNLFLLLEHVQEAFYRDALETGRLDGELREFAATVLEQERAHVAFLQDRLGDRAHPPPETVFEQALTTPERFRAAGASPAPRAADPARTPSAVVEALERKGYVR